MRWSGRRTGYVSCVYIEAVLILRQEHFLGLPAVNLHNNEGALAQVQTKLKALLAEGATLDCFY